MSTPISTYLQDVPHLLALVDAGKASVDSLPVEQVIVFLPQEVNANALDILIKEWSVNLPGIGDSTDQVKRDMLDSALELHRFKGSLWSIREVFRIAGMPVIDILESVELNTYNQRYYGGFYYGGGSVYGPAAAHWAQYAIRFHMAATTQPIPNSLSQSMVDVLKEFAPARCELMWLAGYVTTSDGASISDNLTLQVI